VISILVISGPTASGKTKLALDLAVRLRGEIVCADSQQLYRGLDVGTAKPTAAERALVPHHLLDVVDPGEAMDAARWARLADEAIRTISGSGKTPLVVGGTGLYLRTLLHGVVEAPGRDPALRALLEAEAAQKGRAALHRKLAGIDPEAATRIAPNDLVRIVRALEIAEAGITQSELFAAHRFAEQRYRSQLWALDLPRDELHERIDARVVEMFERGLVEESRALVARFGADLPPRLPIGYNEAIAYVRGEATISEAVRRVQVATRRYARRQVIWLRREHGVEWKKPPFDAEQLAGRYGQSCHIAP
jgi:tRNA dimethylallyltransferase